MSSENRSATAMGAARFEYRVWGRGADAVAESVADRGQRSGESTTSDTYLLVAGDPSIGIKIRSGRLQIKRRAEVRAGLERWQPLLSEAFPIALEKVPAELMRLRGVGKRDIVSPDELLRELEAASAGVRGVRTLKHRAFYDVEGCRTEVDRVDASGLTLSSVGLDDASPEKLLGTIRLLGADKFPNAGYPEKLMALLR